MKQVSNSDIDYYESPLGWMKICIIHGFLSELKFVTSKGEETSTHPIIQAVKDQLDHYFTGSLKEFTIPLKPIGTDFQIKVWDLLQTIQYGETWSYLSMAKKYGDEKSIRAIATSNGKNPIAIIIPCHRVIGSDGTLVGYAGGLDKKRWLLDHEAKHAGKTLF